MNLAGQCLYWLTTAVWVPISFGRGLVAIGLGPLHSGLLGVQVIFSYINEASFTVVDILLGIGIFWAFTWLADKVPPKWEQSEIEQAIYADRLLSEKDHRVVELQIAILARQRKTMAAAQRTWLEERNRCTGPNRLESLKGAYVVWIGAPTAQMRAYLTAYADKQHESRFGWKTFRVLAPLLHGPVRSWSG
jgi:hypothetical protein